MPKPLRSSGEDQLDKIRAERDALRLEIRQAHEAIQGLRDAVRDGRQARYELETRLVTHINEQMAEWTRITNKRIDGAMRQWDKFLSITAQRMADSLAQAGGVETAEEAWRTMLDELANQLLHLIRRDGRNLIKLLDKDLDIRREPFRYAETFPAMFRPPADRHPRSDRYRTDIQSGFLGALRSAAGASDLRFRGARTAFSARSLRVNRSAS